MTEQNTTVLQAHKLRSTHAKNALLHGSDRTVSDLRKPYAAVLGGLGLALVVLAVFMVIAVLTDTSSAQALTVTTVLPESGAQVDLPGGTA